LCVPEKIMAKISGRVLEESVKRQEVERIIEG